ncbi:MAG: hypothetical protein LBK44_03745 [Spirochaetales bacterium]|jgi:hypothetical protein|nr:hypothetical protein [Spirochaetales bacterium]
MRAHFFARKARQKNRAFRSKSSEAPRMQGRAAIWRKQNRDQPMRFLWAFRYNPLRAQGLVARRAI